jgi:hypothetical protein
MLRVTDPDFAPTDETGWVLDRTFGVDDLLQPPTGSGPSHLRLSLCAQWKQRTAAANGFGGASAHGALHGTDAFIIDLGSDASETWR